MKRLVCAILSAGMLSGLAISCSLDENVYSNVSGDYIIDADIACNVLNGVYRAMGTDGVYRQNLSMVFACPTDEYKGEGNHLTAQRAEMAGAFTASSSYVQATWQALYKVVYNANSFIETMAEKYDGFSSSDKPVIDVYVAEAKAIRALMNFELVRWFGNVPLIKTTAQSYTKDENVVQAAPEDVYAFIEKDLLEAIDALPWADDDEVRDDNSFRFSKGAAMGLLAKVYATWAGYPLKDGSKWQNAADIAGELVASGHHSLLSSFETLWKNSANSVWDPSESLIEISYYSPTTNTGESGRVGKFNGVKSVI